MAISENMPAAFGGEKYWLRKTAQVEIEEKSPEQSDKETILPDAGLEQSLSVISQRLEKLSSPEAFESRLKENIENAEMEIDFSDAVLETRSGVGMLVGELGGEKVTAEMVAKAKEVAEKTRGILGVIKGLDLGLVAGKAAEGLKNFLKDNVLKMTPLILGPMAAVMGGDVKTAVLSSVELTSGLYALDKVLDSFMETAEDVIPPEYLVLLVAGTTNLPEFGASQASAWLGDPLSEVGATPLGSNPTNLYLTGFAFAGALRDRALAEGIIKPEEKMNFSAYRQVFKKIEFKKIKKELGMAGLFATDALAFQFLVRPGIKRGDFVPLGVWLALNLPFLARYFKKTTFSREAKLGVLSENIGSRQIDELRDKIFEQEDEPAGGTGAFLTLMSLLELRHQAENPAHEKAIKQEIEKTFELLREEISQDPNFQKYLQDILSPAKMKDAEALFRFAKIDTSKEGKLDKKKMLKLAAGMTAVVALAVLLDKGVTHMAEAIPNLEKGWAGFVFMSLFTSLPEFLTTLKFFKRGRDRAAVKNIADSNALNVVLTKGALLSSAVRGLAV